MTLLELARLYWVNRQKNERFLTMTLTSILVAVDETPYSAQVVAAIGSLQLTPTAKIVLCHIIPTKRVELAADLPHQGGSEYPEVIQQLQRYQEQLTHQSELEVVSGEPATEIVRLAHIHRCQLILIGSRGLMGVDRIIQGSVSGQVVEEASCSVFVVKIN
jgi:nucleotide-binding universal stress UspA family protein